MKKEEIKIEERLNGIFNLKSYQKDALQIIERGYRYSEIDENLPILFIGMNPSFDEKKEKQNFQAKQSSHKYYRPFQDFFKNTKWQERWNYIDLFYFRETNQKLIQERFQNEITFLTSQLELTYKIIIKINPKLIIVCNAGARKYLGMEVFKNKKNNQDENIWLGLKLRQDDEIGTYRISELHDDSIVKKIGINNLVDVPIFFSGMLSGQRALDLGSLERLKWHVKKVLEGYEMKIK